MLYSSTRGQDNNVSFLNVLLNGLSKDGGLYVPNSFPKIKKQDLIRLKHLSYSELAFEITKDFVLSDDISKDDYRNIVKKTYGKEFSKDIISIDSLNNKEHILNLFHGPTFAFKDYALQLLGNLYDFILKSKKLKLTILGATSGDTGSAAIYGCSKSTRANVFVLFPKGKVSEIQRKQMTTYDSDNVTNIEVEGNFDDCQKWVKDFFKLNNRIRKYNLAAINSINWVRILGQLVYYFWSYLRVEDKFNPINFVVPTGNFGNVYAGFVCKIMGLPIKKLIVCSNRNDILTRFFLTGRMKKEKVFKSLSPSMDIQVSSNFERLLFYYIKDGTRVDNLFTKLEKNGEFKVNNQILSLILNEFYGGMLSDEDTLKAIKAIFVNHNIIVDPHTAVGYSVGKKILSDKDKRIYFATAHYSKFFETVSKSVNKKLTYPIEFRKILKKKERFITMTNSIKCLKKVIDEYNTEP